jgi:hypothetical protein
MPREKADFAWYSAESRKQGLPPRCPLACAELCPRYYQSLDALGREGRITKISSARSASLERKWKVFQAVIAEEEPYTSIASWPDRQVLGIHHFCPEVSYEVYGSFASDMHEYVDEIDREFGEDPRWMSITPQHYTECREYSIHATFAAGKPSKTPGQRKDLNPKLRWQVLARDAFTCVYCGKKPPEVALTVDHKVSVKDGGSDDLDNLVTACVDCNSGKAGSSL